MIISHALSEEIIEDNAIKTGNRRSIDSHAVFGENRGEEYGVNCAIAN